jgi:hypothetical protein
LGRSHLRLLVRFLTFDGCERVNQARMFRWGGTHSAHSFTSTHSHLSKGENRSCERAFNSPSHGFAELTGCSLPSEWASKLKRRDSLASKLQHRPSKKDLEDRNIIPGMNEYYFANVCMNIILQMNSLYFLKSYIRKLVYSQNTANYKFTMFNSSILAYDATSFPGSLLWRSYREPGNEVAYDARSAIFIPIPLISKTHWNASCLLYWPKLIWSLALKNRPLKRLRGVLENVKFIPKCLGINRRFKRPGPNPGHKYRPVQAVLKWFLFLNFACDLCLGAVVIECVIVYFRCESCLTSSYTQ